MNEKPLSLHAGPLKINYVNGMIDSICFNQFEVIRRVYMALRDRYWNTIPYTIKEFTLYERNDRFALSYTATHRDQAKNIAFIWKGSIKGTDEGTITFTMKGTSESTFLRNRIGWCILHPLDICTGIPCMVEKADGSKVASRFPGSAIAPYQPFTDVVALSWEFSPGCVCTVRCYGDAFETEDQRNWSDGSFKTYSTPLSLPAPVEVTVGTIIEQTVTISVAVSRTVRCEPPFQKPLDLEKSFGKPVDGIRIGLRCLPDKPLHSEVQKKCASLGISHLRFEVHPEKQAINETLDKIAAQCAPIGCGAEIALHCTQEYEHELATVASYLHKKPLPVASILVFRNDSAVTPYETAESAYRLLRECVPRNAVVMGTNRYFVELNRADPIDEPYEALCFSATPQVHTFDKQIIMKNLEGLRDCTYDAKRISRGKPIYLTPLTLRPRKDPLRPQKDGGSDPRQNELFGAAWLTGAIAMCIFSGVDSLTCLNAAGPDGIMSEDGHELYPAYQVIASGLTFARSLATVKKNNWSEKILAIKMVTDAETALLLTNRFDTHVTIPIHLPNDQCMIANLDSNMPTSLECDPLFWQKNARPLVTKHRAATAITLQPYDAVRIVIANT